jgi:hypothetical protein
VHALRGARETQVLGQGHEVAQVSQFHGNPIVTSMTSIISMGIHHFRENALVSKLRAG